MENERMDRRKFLKLTGCGAVIALVGGRCTLADQAEASCPYGRTNDPYPGECGRYVDNNGNGICDLSEKASTQSTSGSSSATATPSQNVSDVQTTFVCHRGCRYPGHCSRFVDSDSSGICDISERSAAR
jgi:hypothetical protein